MARSRQVLDFFTVLFKICKLETLIVRNRVEKNSLCSLMEANAMFLGLAKHSSLCKKGSGCSTAVRALACHYGSREFESRAYLFIFSFLFITLEFLMRSRKTLHLIL